MQKKLGECVRMLLYLTLVLFVTYWGYLIIPTFERLANGVKNELKLVIEMSEINNKSSELNDRGYKGIQKVLEDTEDEEKMFDQYAAG
jgi:hypothetical protein